MKVMVKTQTCTMISFDETKERLIQMGWLGDEHLARIYRLDGKTEIRIFKNDGQTYALDQKSNDFMIQAKIKTLLSLDSRHKAEKPEINVGDTIQILKMEGEPEYAGRVGVVQTIDGIGQLHGTWGGLAVELDYDKIEKVRLR